MKIIRYAFLGLLVSVAAYGQTVDLGMGAFANNDGAILMTVDAGLVNRTIDSPYVMFVVYMGVKDQGKPVTA